MLIKRPLYLLTMKITLSKVTCKKISIKVLKEKMLVNKNGDKNRDFIQRHSLNWLNNQPGG